MLGIVVKHGCPSRSRTSVGQSLAKTAPKRTTGAFLYLDVVPLGIECQYLSKCRLGGAAMATRPWPSLAEAFFGVNTLKDRMELAGFESRPLRQRKSP